MAKTILIVDDSQFILEINSFTLSSAGYVVHAAPSGHAALEILGKEHIDLVAADINMPGMDGYTLIRKIRADRVLEDVPAVIITTEAEARDKKKGFDAGANAYLVKPFKPEELIGQIRLLIGE